MLTVFTGNAFSAETMSDLFRQKSWTRLETLFNSLKKKTTLDYSLMANAYRMQERWSDAVAILESQSKNFPSSIKPYADMTLMLGYEKLNRTQDAINLSERLYRVAPVELKYYIAFAQYRIFNNAHNEKSAANSLTRMLANADTDEKKITTLSKLVVIQSNANKIQHSLQLLELQPSNKDAAKILMQHKKPYPNNVLVALGVYAHQTGDNAGAFEYLKNASGRKAVYYRAWALSRMKRNTEALNTWANLILSGNSYSLSSVTRIANLAKDKGMYNPCVAALERIAKERKGEVQARALQSLVNLYGKNQAQRKSELEARILKSYPNTNYAFNVLWSRAWNNINSGNFSEAAKLLKLANSPGVTSYRRARILHWLAYSQERAGQKKEAEKTRNTLKQKYPLSIYGLLTGQQLRIIDGTNPNLTLRPSEIEQWGFMYHAYLKLSRPKASTRELYRALILSRWLGLDESYNEARRLETLLTTGTTLYRFDLEALYPRPFKNYVDNAAKTYNVENNFVWAIMRQESAFQPVARSWVGAAGLMQLMPATAKEEAKRAGLANYDLYNINDNIRLGTSHLNWLSKNFSRPEWVMAAYNAGSGNARKWLKDGGERMDLARWIENIKFDETCNYVQRVSANLEIYRMLYKNNAR